MSKSSKFANRVSDIPPFQVMKVLARAKQLEAEGRDIIHLEVGEPDFGTPAPVMAAAQHALRDQLTHYTPALGLPELRQAIADYYQQRYQLDISPDRVVVTPGASGGLLLTFALLCNPGENVLMSDPGYPCNRQFLRLMEAEAELVPVNADNGYQMTAELLDQYWQASSRGVLLASPSNPTGTLASREQLQNISDAVRKRNGFLIVDEIYDGLVYDQTPVSILEINDQAYVINSFSKYFGMTGWRIGWIIAPENAVPELEKLVQNIFIAAPTLAQQAAIAAFQPECLEILEARKKQLKARRDYLLPELKALGFKVGAPSDGAFFIYANIDKFSNDSEAFCLKLLEEQGIAITPGIDFGSHHALTHVRIAYTQPIHRLQEAVERLRLALGK